VHEREVAKLIAEGWSEGGFRRDLVRTIAQWYASNNGGRLATTDCRKGDRCRCAFADEPAEGAVPDCFWDCGHDAAGEFSVRPDAHRFDVENQTVWIAEVNVTSHAGAEKWAGLWFNLDGDEWMLRLLVVDRNGVRSEPFGTDEMFGAFYAELAASV
jgi:hypothetical protein